MRGIESKWNEPLCVVSVVSVVKSKVKFFMMKKEKGNSRKQRLVVVKSVKRK